MKRLIAIAALCGATYYGLSAAYAFAAMSTVTDLHQERIAQIEASAR